MKEPVAYLNGEFVPISRAAVSVFDLGLVQGAAVTEMIRTFAHQPFRVEQHLDRLRRSLKAVGFRPSVTMHQLQNIVEEVVDRNAGLISDEQDLGIVLFVTAGQNLTYVGSAGAELARIPTTCVHTFPLPFELWLGKLTDGQHLITPSVRQVPPESLDPRIKVRSRLHWHLADREARLVDPAAGALLLDRDGLITETSSGNFFIVRDGTLVTPTERTTLGGVSQQVVSELAAARGWRLEARDLRVYDVLNADEAFTSSTPYCLLPVTRLNGELIGEGQPGPVFHQLVQDWSNLVGIDIVEQMRTVAAARQKTDGAR